MLLPFFANCAIIAVFLEIIASAIDLVDCGERPDGSSGVSRLLTLKHVKQMVSK
jgi:hypothetical protein